MRENAAPATPLGDRRYCFLPSEKVRYSDNYRFDRLSFRIDVRSRLSHCCSRFVPEFEPIAAVYRLRVPTLLRFLTDGGPRNRPHQGIDVEWAILRIKQRNFPDKGIFCLSSPL